MRANSVEGVKRGRDAGVVGWERRGRGVDVIRVMSRVQKIDVHDNSRS